MANQSQRRDANVTGWQPETTQHPAQCSGWEKGHDSSKKRVELSAECECGRLICVQTAKRAYELLPLHVSVATCCAKPTAKLISSTRELAVYCGRLRSANSITVSDYEGWNRLRTAELEDDDANVGLLPHDLSVVSDPRGSVFLEAGAQSTMINITSRAFDWVHVLDGG